MKPGQMIGTGITASAIAHLSVLALVLFFTEVHPFGTVTAEPIAVDIVSPDEAPPPPKNEEPLPPPKAQPSEALDLSSKAATASPPPPAASSEPQKQVALSAPRPAAKQASAQPQPRPPSTSPSTPPTPAYIPPEPDLSIKYHVMLGLPPDLPVDGPKDKHGDGFDAPASKTADIASSLVAEFRRHLKTCAKLPPSIAASDNLTIRLRVMMTPAGELAAEPILIEASASAKGPALMQSAISALQACQPYTMLPVDRYGEWKVLDLSFTPQDFAGSS